MQKLYLHQTDIDSLDVSESDIASSVDQQINFWINSAGSREKLEEYQGKTINQMRSDLHDDFKNRQLIEKMRHKLV